MARGRTCLNCDNRHGCRTPQPRCLRLTREAAELYLRGKELMRRRGLLAACARCGLFKQCWRRAEYERALAGPPGPPAAGA